MPVDSVPLFKEKLVTKFRYIKQHIYVATRYAYSKNNNF